MGTKPWLGIGAFCLGGVLLCGCQSEEKRPFSPPPKSVTFPGAATGPNTTPGGFTPNNATPGGFTPNNTTPGGWPTNPSPSGLKPAGFQANSPPGSSNPSLNIPPLNPPTNTFPTAPGGLPTGGSAFGTGVTSPPPVDRGSGPLLPDLAPPSTGGPASPFK